MQLAEKVYPADPWNGRNSNPQAEIAALLGAEGATGDRLLAALPFACGDATVGVEDELQAVVIGNRKQVDLAISLEQSNFLKNIHKRVAAGELPAKTVLDFERFLEESSGHAWDNSWVRFPWSALSPAANQVFQEDLLADKRESDGPLRRDLERFIFLHRGEQWLRVPISYLLKLALADASGQPKTPSLVRRTGERFLAHFLNDNTSPETFSLHISPLRPETLNGRAVARESLRRFLLTQLLIEYANEQFGLRQNGQQAVVSFAPTPPIGQRRLNELIPDSFYRELFMSPCLSGWDEGEAKHRYMSLCHQTLSRSQLNAVAKLKAAGIITRNLVVLPNISNLSLANNGTHVSIGSRRLGALLADPVSGFSPAHEKHAGDLAIKIIEHFLPLFVGTYSAAPYRLDFEDFHPERALGFLPHELDYTHLRMIWRRWTHKAQLKVFGHPVTPFGPPLLDQTLRRLFSLKGDTVTDFRLIDYLVALRSTDQSPALDGRLGSGERLRQDLTAMGVFDAAMPLYLLYRLRQFKAMGFSGFEGRHYSLFASLDRDLTGAVNLQLLLTALAYKYIVTGKVTHAHIPDEPTIESERRQIFFGRAIGIPTFYVRRHTRNQFLAGLLGGVEKVRSSRRYPGYHRVLAGEYCLALVSRLKLDGADLIDAMGLAGTLRDLEIRLREPEQTVAVRLTHGILEEAGKKSPFHLSGRRFNEAAERYYRASLRRQHLEEALAIFAEDLERLDHLDSYRALLKEIQPDGSVSSFLAANRQALLTGRLEAGVLGGLIRLLLLAIHRESRRVGGEIRLMGA